MVSARHTASGTGRTPAPGQQPEHKPWPEPSRHPGAGSGLDNLALQDLLSHGLLRRRLAIGAASDPAEAEADRMADAALRGPADEAPEHAVVRRQPRTHSLLAGSAGLDSQPALGQGQPLDEPERAFFEERFGADLGAVRIHDNGRAAASAGALQARAFSLGQHIAFAPGAYQPGNPEGRRLLAHELAHVLQAGAGPHAAAPALRRQALAPGPLTLAPPLSAPMCRAESEPAPAREEQMCRAPPDPANPTALELSGTVDERVLAFKQLVKVTAIHRLMDNRRNLASWADLVAEKIPEGDLAAAGLLQTGAASTYFDLQDQRDPGLRELGAANVYGKYRFCTNCHIRKELSATRAEREMLAPEGWRSPNQMRAGAPAPRPWTFSGDLPAMALFMQASQASGAFAAKPARSGLDAYQPAPGTDEARLHRRFPDPAATRTALEHARPILEALGPEGYRVLPADLLTRMERSSPGAVRTLILDAIATRRGNYLELIGKINDGEIGYEFFGPVVKKLMPLADAEVRAAIQDEMDTKHFWDRVEQVVVAAMTALALLLMIFPPTTALGIAFFASLELSLGYYGVQQGNEATRMGKLINLGTGTGDVFDPALQDSADAMVFGGFISVATGYLGIGSGFVRTAAAASHFVPPPSSASLMEVGGAESTALVRSGGRGVARTLESGEYVLTIAEDGSMMATVASRPDLLIMVRGEVAILYQLMEGGGMRVLARATMPVRGGPVPGATPLLTAGGEGNALATVAREGPIITPPLRQGPIITPAPREMPQLTSGPATTHSWEEISRMRQPALWQNRQAHMQELYGAPGEQHFRIPGTGGRFVDVPVDLGPGRWLFAGEVKTYQRWIGVPGQRGGILNEVGLSERIETQIAHDIWLRDNVPGFDPRWLFTDAPPAEALRQALREARIPFVEYL